MTTVFIFVFVFAAFGLMILSIITWPSPPYSKWHLFYRCVQCREEISNTERMYGSGMCPHCGFKHKNAGTIVECTEHARKNHYKRKTLFWIFPVWEIERTEEKDFKDSGQ